MPHRDGPDGPFHGVGVELDPAIFEVAVEGIPADQGVTDGIGEGTTRRQALQLGF